jgi:hypothetical protein
MTEGGSELMRRGPIIAPLSDTRFPVLGFRMARKAHFQALRSRLLLPKVFSTATFQPSLLPGIQLFLLNLLVTQLPPALFRVYRSPC